MAGLAKKRINFWVNPKKDLENLFTPVVTPRDNLATRSSMYVYLSVHILALAQGIIYAQTPLFLLAITSNDMKIHRPISELKYLTYVRSSILI